MDTDLFLILFYISAMQVAMLIFLIITYTKRKPLIPSEQCNPEKVKVMVHYENGEVHLKEGVIVEGNMWKALEGKSTAYVQANGSKYLINDKSSFKDNTFHVIDKTEIETPTPKPEIKVEPPKETEKPPTKLSQEEVQALYEKWKDLPSEHVQYLFNNYLKERGMEVKPSDK